jgi:hypothetical protein
MSYEAEWKSVKRAVLRYYLVFFLWWLPALLAVVAVAASVGWVLANVVFIVIAIAFVVVEQKLSRPAFYFKCPRCHERFWLSKYTNRFLTKPCANCGLPAWAKDDR